MILKIFLLIDLILILACIKSVAQEKKDNTIIVKNVSFEVVCKQLVDKGFILEVAKEDYGQVKTGEYPYSNIGKMYLQIKYKDSTAFIQCFANPGVVFMDQHSGFTQVMFNGWKGSDSRKCAAIWDCYAKSLNGEISYARL